jgi:ketosteroid isomerase-like protein
MCLLSIFVVLLSFLQGTPAALTQTSASTIMTIEQRFTTALLKKDAAALDELLADDILHIGFEGQFAGIGEYMAFFKRDIWRYRKYEPTNVAVKILGDVAVVTGRVDRTIVIENNVTTGAFAFTHVWSHAGDRWRMVSSQLTTIPNPAS